MLTPSRVTDASEFNRFDVRNLQNVTYVSMDTDNSPFVLDSHQSHGDRLMAKGHVSAKSPRVETVWIVGPSSSEA